MQNLYCTSTLYQKKPLNTHGNHPLVFLNSSLSSLAERTFNEQVIALTKRCGFRVYAPQHQLPIGATNSAVKILNENRRAVQKADLIVAILDKPGLGVAYEIGLAQALGKPIIAFRSDIQDYLGKIFEGVWHSLPATRRARTLEELSACLERAFRRLS